MPFVNQDIEDAIIKLNRALKKLDEDDGELYAFQMVAVFTAYDRLGTLLRVRADDDKTP